MRAGRVAALCILSLLPACGSEPVELREGAREVELEVSVVLRGRPTEGGYAVVELSRSGKRVQVFSAAADGTQLELGRATMTSGTYRVRAWVHACDGKCSEERARNPEAAVTGSPCTESIVVDEAIRLTVFPQEPADGRCRLTRTPIV